MSSQAQTILLFGDSLTASYNVPSAKGWAKLIAGKWQQSEPDLTLVNASVSGETTAGGLARLPQALAAHQPDIVWLELGANDGLQGFPINVPSENLAAMIRLCHEQGARVILAEMLIPPNYGVRYGKQFVAMYSQLAEQFELTLAPFFMSRVAGKADYMFADGIHPNTQAQPLLADDVEPILLSAARAID